jgi:hypothetical protein
MLPVLFLSALCASAPIDANTASLMTDVVTTAFADDARLDVISSADVKRQLDFEAEKQVLGCAADTSCLAEIAAAMGARFVVHGQLGTLDDVVVLTLNLFDSEAAQAAGRTIVKDRSLSTLSDKVGPAVKDLIHKFLARVPEGTRPRVLVLNITPPTTAPTTTAPTTTAPPTTAPPTTATAASAAGGNAVLWWSGVGTGAVGVVGVGACIALLAIAVSEDARIDGDLTLDADSAKNAYASRKETATTGLVAGGLGVAGLITGGALMFLGSGE